MKKSEIEYITVLMTESQKVCKELGIRSKNQDIILKLIKEREELIRCLDGMCSNFEKNIFLKHYYEKAKDKETEELRIRKNIEIKELKQKAVNQIKIEKEKLNKKIIQKNKEIEELKSKIDDIMLQENESLKEQLKIMVDLIKQYRPDIDVSRFLKQLSTEDYQLYIDTNMPDIIVEKDKKIDELKSEIEELKKKYDEDIIDIQKVNKQYHDEYVKTCELKQSKIKVDEELIGMIDDNITACQKKGYYEEEEKYKKLRSILQPKEKKYEKIELDTECCRTGDFVRCGNIWTKKNCPYFQGLTKNKKYVKCGYKERGK